MVNADCTEMHPVTSDSEKKEEGFLTSASPMGGDKTVYNRELFRTNEK